MNTVIKYNGWEMIVPVSTANNPEARQQIIELLKRINKVSRANA